MAKTQGLCSKLYFLFTVVLVVLSPKFALSDESSRPFWTQRSSYVEGQILYAVGVVSHAKTVETGRQQAWENGKKEINNFAQIMDLSGVDITTQMTFQERNKDGTVNVFRLLKVSLPQLIQWKKHLLNESNKVLSEQNSEINKKIAKRKSLLLILDQSTEALTEQSQEIRKKILMRKLQSQALRQEVSDLNDQINDLKSWIAVKQKQIRLLQAQVWTANQLKKRAHAIQKKVNLMSSQASHYIKCGMTAEEVESILGAPRAVNVNSGSDLSFYNYGTTWIRLDNSIVVSIQHDDNFESPKICH